MPERTCSVVDCDKPHEARGWCKLHYERWKRLGDVRADIPPESRRPGPRPVCSVEDCKAPEHSRGFCSLHYGRWRRHGDPLAGRTRNGDGGLAATHEWMARHFPYVGRCEYCGRVRKTHYASIGHTYTRNRLDWFELCARCHKWFDGRP